MDTHKYAPKLFLLISSFMSLSWANEVRSSSKMLASCDIFLLGSQFGCIYRDLVGEVVENDVG